MSIVSAKNLQQKRLEICMPCEHIAIVPLLGFAKCNACGCPIRSKIMLDNSKCPKGKW